MIYFSNTIDVPKKLFMLIIFIAYTTHLRYGYHLLIYKIAVREK